MNSSVQARGPMLENPSPHYTQEHTHTPTQLTSDWSHWTPEVKVNIAAFHRSPQRQRKTPLNLTLQLLCQRKHL